VSFADEGLMMQLADRVLGTSESGFYKWRNYERGGSGRDPADARAGRAMPVLWNGAE
jgi:hypothetical protein